MKTELISSRYLLRCVRTLALSRGRSGGASLSPLGGRLGGGFWLGGASLLTIFVVFICLGACGQERNEISIWAFSGGVSTLQYKPVIGNRKNAVGGSFGIGYARFFTRNIGGSIGLEWAFHTARMEIGRLAGNRKTVDIDGNDYEFRYVMSDYVEVHKAAYINIPLVVRYQTGKYPKIYASAGFKIGLPLEAWYSLWRVKVKSSGYYIYEDQEYTTQEFMGFGTFSDKTRRGDFELGIAYILSAEAGMKWRLGGNFLVYTGLYFDCGVNDILREEPAGELLRHSDYPGHYVIGSVLSSQYADSGPERDIVKRIIPIAAGVKVRVAYALR